MSKKIQCNKIKNCFQSEIKEYLGTLQNDALRFGVTMHLT